MKPSLSHETSFVVGQQQKYYYLRKIYSNLVNTSIENMNFVNLGVAVSMTVKLI